MALPARSYWVWVAISVCRESCHHQSISHDATTAGLRRCKTHCLPSLLDGMHQSIEMRAEGLEATGVEHETSLTGGMAGGMRRGAGLGEGYLLVLTKELDLAGRETELGV